MRKDNCSRDNAQFLQPSSEDDLRWLLKERPGKNGFETMVYARREDVLRITCLRTFAETCPHDSSSKATLALDLAARLRANQGLRLRKSTYASSRWTCYHRRLFCGAVLEANRSSPNLEVALFTIVPNRGWLVRHGELSNVQPRELLQRFRQQLVRTGLSCRHGWIIAAMHGDYSLETGAYQLHLHLLAVGDAIAIVSSLRRLPMYRISDGEKVGKFVNRSFGAASPTLHAKSLIIWPRDFGP